MAIVEGIGDEVIFFFLGLLLTVISIVLVGLAWATTDYPANWQLRTVYLLDGRRLQRLQSQMLTHHTESATITEGNEEAEPSRVEEVSTEQVEEEVEQGTSPEVKPPDEPDDEACGPSTSAETIAEQEQADIIATMDSQTTIRQRRLAFLNSFLETDQPEGSCTTTFTSTPTASSGNAPTATPVLNPEGERLEAESPSNSNFTIKLKYLNENLRSVIAEPTEQLGDFRQRHFATEIAQNKLVRLIFNGHILHQDTVTLANYGMFDNCVVHCLIHQQMMTPPNLTEARGESVNVGTQQRERDWDLGNLLIATVSFSLGSAWYFRYQYPHLFTVTATVGLVAITGIFTVISAGIYIPEFQRVQERIRRQREAPQRRDN